MAKHPRIFPPVPDGYKYCPVCNTPKPATAEFFHKKCDSPDGLKRRCKDCIQAIRKQPEQHAKELEQGRNHYALNRESEIAKTRKWQAEHKERDSERKRRQRAKPHEQEKARQRTRIWRETHQEYIREHHKEYRKSYYLLHQDKFRLQKLHRRAREKNIQGTHTTAQLKEQLKRQKQKCYYCSQSFEKRGDKYVYHVDHTFPLSRVSSDIPANDISYLVLTCPRCNESKGSKFPWEWPEGGRLL